MEELILNIIKNFSFINDYSKEIEQCKIQIEKTEEYTGTWKFGSNTTWGKIRIICPNLNIQKILQNHKDSIENELRNNLELGDNYLGGKYIPLLEIKLGEIKNKDSLSIDILFENIESDIIKNIEEAEFFIWIAVAWITNKKIIDSLNKKSEEGLNIQVICMNDGINNSHNYFSDNKNLQIYKYNPYGKYDNIMHNKFCIIDGKKVINGSYNWSCKAEYNKENITILQSKIQGEEKILSYMKEFMKLKKECLKN